jgi:hypothetical protein
MNSQVYINGKKVAESGASDISIVNGDVYIDGKSIDELTEDVEEPQTDEVADPNLYETKNVDAYNKWYNAKGKKMIMKEHEKTKKVFLWVLGSIGAVLVFISLGFVVAEIRLRIRNRREKRLKEIKPTTMPGHSNPPKPPAPKWPDVHPNMTLPEVDSPIKNRNR